MDNCKDSQREFCDYRFSSQDRKLDNLDKKLDTLIDVIKGNGKLGMVLRVDRLEQARKRQVKLIWVIISGIFALLCNTAAGLLGF
jgi:hypothetical protein